jgi:hypothetical protein
MTTIAAPASLARSSSALWPLARLEARRYLRHPLYLLGVVFLLLSVVAMAGQAGSDRSPLSAPVAPAFLMGVFGLVVTAQLTRSGHRLGRAAGATPVPERIRTLAVACAFVVPALTTAVWLAAYLTIYSGRVPDGAWWFGRLSTAHVLSMLVATSVVAAVGGPALGLLVARWVRWRPAPLLGALVLVVVEMISQGGSGFPDQARLVFPWTAWAVGVTDHRAVYLAGNPVPWLCYALALCALAVVAAVRHDPDAERRTLRVIAAALVVVAVVALTLSITSGVQHRRSLSGAKAEALVASALSSPTAPGR